MKLHLNTKKSTLAGIICAAALCAGTVCFAVHFYKNTPVNLPDTTLSGEIDNLPTAFANGGGQDENTDNHDNSQADSADGSQTDTDNDGTNSYTNDSENDKSSDLSDNSLNADDNVSDDVTKTISDDADAMAENAPSSNLHSDVKPDGTQTDKEYFTTSITDGETVEDESYRFTITQLDSTLKLRSTAVFLGGSEVKQFSGKLRLSEGKNLIRIVCSYTDQSNAVVSVFKDYTVYLKTGEISFETNLSDHEASSPALSFYACAFIGDKEIPIRAQLNGQELSGDKNFTAALSQGENLIRLYAESGEKSAEKTFTVTYSPSESFGISTDLYDQTVYSEAFSFYCTLVGCDDSGKLNVFVNAKSVKGENGSFQCTLEYGENIIKAAAKNGSQTITQSYTITLLPPTSAEDLPILKNISLTDGQTVKGSLYPLTLCAADKNGSRIYSNAICVILNDTVIVKSWEDADETGYSLPLRAGENNLLIRLTDSLGASSDFYYTINSLYAESGEEIGRISISLSAALVAPDVVCTDYDFPIYEGENGFDTLSRFLEQNGFTVSSSGSGDSKYISRIIKNGAFAGGHITDSAAQYLASKGISQNGVSDSDSLGEFDYTQGSGWTYRLNGKIPAYAISSAVFSDGDTVSLEFTLDYGNDLE